MIMVEGEVSGKKYREPFSKGVLARSLTRAEMIPIRPTPSLHRSKPNSKRGATLIKLDDLITIVRQRLKEEDSEIATQYGL